MQYLMKKTIARIHFEPIEGARPPQEKRSAAAAVSTLLRQLGCKIPKIFNDEANGKRDLDA
jgi:hypothetical protein